MINKNLILSSLLLFIFVTSSSCLGRPFSDYIETIAANSTATASAIRNAIPNRAVSSYEKMEIVYKMVMAANVLYTFASVTKKCFFPSQEDKLQSLLQQKAFKIIIAKDSFNESLLNHKTEPKNECGIPLACKDDAESFAREAGIDELNKMVKEFKAAYGQGC